MNDMVPRKTLVKYGTTGLGGLAGGIILLALHALAPVPALIIGGIIGVIGLAISSSKDDRTPGLVTAAAGGITALSAVPLIGGIAGTLMSISGIGLLIMGGWNLFKFIRGYRKNR